MNVKQRLFCEYYCGEAGGNGYEAAILAGYSRKSARQSAYKLLQNRQIVDYCNQLNSQVSRKNVATIEQIQTFWTETFMDETNKTSDRLKASELLAKAKGMFNIDW